MGSGATWGGRQGHIAIVQLERCDAVEAGDEEEGESHAPEWRAFYKSWCVGRYITAPAGGYEALGVRRC